MGIQYKIIKHSDLKEISDLFHASLRVESEEEPELVDGFVDYNRKDIHLLVNQGFKTGAQVLRHELIHAFLYEIGEQELCNNEIIVEKFSKWIPQIEKLRKEAERC